MKFSPTYKTDLSLNRKGNKNYPNEVARLVVQKEG